ncbi:MAG TPA: hypothetical protein VFB31_16285, partial [Pseudolabrys sp.]|nr:hypothetical protein [Pseudolabrys sp.]
VPKTGGAGRFGYFKFCRRAGEFPEASAAALFDPERRVARIFVGALATPPQPLGDFAAAIAEEGPACCTREAALAAVSRLPLQGGEAERRMRAGALLRALRQVYPA